MAETAAARTGTLLHVQKRTGTLGDTLIAWGLALVASEVTKREVALRKTPESFEITVRATHEQLTEACERYVPTTRVMLPWLASFEKRRHPPTGIDFAVDRDVLRADYERVRQQGQRPDATGDSPVVAAHPLAPKYPLFRVLTNPGTQWTGFNSFVERARIYWTPDGVSSLLCAFATGPADGDLDAQLDELMTQLGLRTAGDRRRNPPGFLFPGLSKGPTMRLERNGVVIGQMGALDWMQADRGDLSTAELYLAYLGYFAVGAVLSFDGGRVVATPVPDRVSVPRVLAFIDRVRPRGFPHSPAAIAADAALSYAGAALDYLAGFVPEDASTSSNAVVFSGVELADYWMPSGNTYAIDHVTFAPLPRWLGPLRRRQGYDVAARVVATHRQHVQSIGRGDGSEARDAAIAYRESLSGDVLTWLRMVPTWYRAVLSERFVGMWSVSEVEDVVMALQPELTEIIHDLAFEAITGAIRRSTIAAHYARRNRQAGQKGGVTSDRTGSPLSPQYDLIGSLQEAAARHPDEFIRELCEFVASYNDEAMRREHRLVRKEDLEQVIAWVANDRRGVVPALLLAFGVSPRRKTPDARADEVFVDEDLSEDVLDGDE